jgi:DNA-binding Lrp family transcriptional regulator
MIEKILLLVQDIPIVERPYAYIAEKLGMSEEEVLQTLRKAKEEKIIRQVSPIYDTKALGYQSALVAFRVKPERIEEVAQFINTHPGVSHNYERPGGYFNLWITLAVPPDAPLSLEETVNIFAKNTEDYAILRTKRVFKIGVKLGYDSVEERDEVQEISLSVRTLEELDKLIIRHTQDNFPLSERPFLEYAKRLGMDEPTLIEKFRGMKETGLLRRVAAILYHRRAGYSANGMSVWKVEPARMSTLGSLLASFKGVSHCYERETHPKWNYNLYAMIHGRTREEVESLVRKVSEKSGVEDYLILYSIREFKKTRVRYFTDESYQWYELYAR